MNNVALETIAQLREIQYNVAAFAEAIWPHLLGNLAHQTPEERRDLFDGAIEHAEELLNGLRKLRLLMEGGER